MDIPQILKIVFDHDFIYDKKDKSVTLNDRKTTCVKAISQWLNTTLDTIADLRNEPAPDRREGRLGPDTVLFDITANHGLFIISNDKLSVSSQANFSSILCNVCAYKGRWQFEVQLGSKGIMQIGWASRSCHFSQETGVGDTTDSYAYDGNRIKKWNSYSQNYGQAWLSGDIIGCCGDFDVGSLTFYRNGVSMSEAFNDVVLGPGKAYFPAVSLVLGENLVANFGGTPLCFPVPGYEPIQQQPINLVARCNLALDFLYNILPYLYHTQSKTDVTDSNQISDETLLIHIAQLLLYSVASLLSNSYISEACFLPFLEKLADKTKSRKKSQSTTLLSSLLNLFWTFFSEAEMKIFLEQVCNSLLSKFRHVSTTLEYTEQKKNLLILLALCEHTATRQLLIKHVFFDTVKLVEFLHVKMLDESGLISIVDHPWWDSHSLDPEVEDNKSSYIDICTRMSGAIAAVERIQIDLIKVLMTNSDSSQTNASSRKTFLRRLRIYFHDNYMATRSLPLVQTPLPVTLCCFHRLLSAAQELWETDMGKLPVTVRTKLFYDGKINYFTIDRVGGVYSYLVKFHESALIKELGANHDVVSGKIIQENPSSARMVTPMDMWPTIAVRMPQNVQGTTGGMMIPNFVPVLTRLVQQANSSSLGGVTFEATPSVGILKPDHSRVSSGEVFNVQSLMELLDGLVLFYHTSAHKQIAKISMMRDNMEEYVTAYHTTRTMLQQYRTPTKGTSKKKDLSLVTITAEVQNSNKVFYNKLCEQARFMAWVRAAIFSQHKQQQLVQFLTIVFNICKNSSDDGDLFCFLPEYYLDTLFELVRALRSHMDPTCSFYDIPGYQEFLQEVAEFICLRFSDTRIVNAASKDTMIQALANFVADSVTLQALESVPVESQKLMIKGLLKPYEKRAWAQSNWVLVRFWQGCGFAFRYDKSPHLKKKTGPKFIQSDSSIINQTIKPSPSALFQNLISDSLVNNEPMSTAFINSVLNQLNWSFSEFIGMLQEIQNISTRPERVYIESRQLRICSTCFDLSFALLRVLEMIANIAPEIFVDSKRPNSELLVSRLCQLLCQILNRVSSKNGCFQYVVTLEIPDLEAVDHFPILAAVTGILLALFKPELKQKLKDSTPVTPIVKVLLTEPSFQLKSVTYVLGDYVKRKESESDFPAKSKCFSFANYDGDVSDEELDQVTKLIKMLEMNQRRVSALSLNSDDNVCTICYAYPVSVIFEPCNHQSCKSCIGHHLLNGSECFFCKTIIERVVDLQGEIVHDLGSSSENKN